MYLRGGGGVRNASEAYGNILITVSLTQRKAFLPPAVGRAFSPALKLRNKKRGASQTHTAKNVAMSENPGTPELGPRYIRPRALRACEVSFEK